MKSTTLNYSFNNFKFFIELYLLFNLRFSCDIYCKIYFAIEDGSSSSTFLGSFLGETSLLSVNYNRTSPNNNFHSASLHELNKIKL